MRTTSASCVALLALIGLAAATANADIMISTYLGTKIGQEVFIGGGDVVQYDMDTGAAEILLDSSAFTGDWWMPRNVDAFHLMADGDFVLSTTFDQSLGGLSFEPGDLVRYDPAANTASLLFDGSLLGRNENIDGVYVRESGEILLSTTSSACLAGLSFRSGDVVEYNPASGAVSLVFDQDWFSRNEDIDALHVLEDGDLVLSTFSGGTLFGLDFSCGDLVRVDTTARTAEIFISDAIYDTCLFVNTDAFSMTPAVPEPATLALLILGGAIGLIRRRRAG
ncbi:MAG: PEP-CTERM sorting domain-containing protein [Planctomycetes bacterium]|nr:PEP-CTERM sorting domain-containing protein [Planctomycetota bacterium]